MFTLRADKVTLRMEEGEKLASGARNVYRCQFLFSDDWAGLEKTAVFQAGSIRISLPLEEGGSCAIPWEVLEKPCEQLYAGVRGTKDGLTILPTVLAGLGKIEMGAAMGDGEREPTLDIYGQILSDVRRAQEAAASVRQDADNGVFDGPKGEKGEPGAPAVLLNGDIGYQISDSGTEVPTGPWSSLIPELPQGYYLWTRITQAYNSGQPVVSYTVARQGRDGAGNVSSVCGRLPGDGGNIVLAASDLGALPLSGGEMTGSIRMGGNVISGLAAPEEADHAASKDYVDRKFRDVAAPTEDAHAANKAYVDQKRGRCRTLLAPSLWQENVQTAAVPGVTEENDVIVSPAPESQQEYSRCMVRCTEQKQDKLVFTCDTVPTGTLWVHAIILK